MKYLTYITLPLHQSAPLSYCPAVRNLKCLSVLITLPGNTLEAVQVSFKRFQGRTVSLRITGSKPPSPVAWKWQQSLFWGLSPVPPPPRSWHGFFIKNKLAISLLGSQLLQILPIFHSRLIQPCLAPSLYASYLLLQSLCSMTVLAALQWVLFSQSLLLMMSHLTGANPILLHSVWLTLPPLLIRGLTLSGKKKRFCPFV